jgi:hypothetical protein
LFFVSAIDASFLSKNVQRFFFYTTVLTHSSSCFSSFTTSSDKMKFASFRFFSIALLCSSATAFSFPAAGTCNFPGDVDLCGTTPNGDKQWCMSRQADCPARIECAENSTNIDEAIDCIFSYVYCTANVDAAIEQGYECDSQVDCSGRRTQDPFGWRTIPSLMQSMMAITEATGKRAPVIQGAKGCVTAQCGTAPDGTPQGYMLDPADCAAAEACGPNCTLFEYLFCAEESEIDKAVLLTSYECTGNITATPNNVSFEVCDE